MRKILITQLETTELICKIKSSGNPGNLVRDGYITRTTLFYKLNTNDDG